jgi:hypothetical protein
MALEENQTNSTITDAAVTPADERPEDEAPKDDAPPSEAKSEDAPSDDEGADLDDALGAAFDKLKSGDTLDDDGDDEPEAKADDADGKDAKTDEKSEPEDDGPPPPQTWSKDVREKWKDLPTDVRNYVAQREAAMHGQFSQMGRQLAQARPIVETVAKFQDVFERNNVSPDQGIAALLTAQKALDQAPAESLLNLAESYGVLDQLRQALGGQQDEYGLPPDPEVSALKSELQQLRNQMTQREQQQEAAQRAAVQQQQAARHQHYVNGVTQYASSKPDFDMVANEVAQLIPVVRQHDPSLSDRDVLDQAYQRAIWANPETRQRQIERQQKEQQNAAQEAAKRARSANGINVRGQPRSNAAPNLDSELDKVWARMQS